MFGVCFIAWSLKINVISFSTQRIQMTRRQSVGRGLQLTPGIGGMVSTYQSCKSSSFVQWIIYSPYVCSCLVPIFCLCFSSSIFLTMKIEQCQVPLLLWCHIVLMDSLRQFSKLMKEKYIWWLIKVFPFPCSFLYIWLIHYLLSPLYFVWALRGGVGGLSVRENYTEVNEIQLLPSGIWNLKSV